MCDANACWDFVGWKRQSFPYVCFFTMSMWVTLLLYLSCNFRMSAQWALFCSYLRVPLLWWGLLFGFTGGHWWSSFLNWHPYLSIRISTFCSGGSNILAVKDRWDYYWAFLLCIQLYLRVRVSVNGCWWKLSSIYHYSLQDHHFEYLWTYVCYIQTLFRKALHHFYQLLSIFPSTLC